MYHYDDFDTAFVAARVEQFRDQVARRLSGELTEEQFRPHRLMNGLYLQLHSYMLRIAVPYGTLNSRQMRKLAEIARSYDRGYGHFTTRQNIQFNWPALKDTPDILAELASVEMHAIQTSGNCIRNITADHFAGVADDEIADPRPYAEILRQWSSLHPEFSFLPRKFKIAVNGASHDRAVIQAHDIGLQVVRNDAGELGFTVYVGGGLGRTPFIGRKVREFLPERDLLGYVEAILRVYNLEGRRDNKYKARIKILLHEKSLETLREEIEAEFAARDRKLLDLPPEEVARIRAYLRAARARAQEAASAIGSSGARARIRASPASSPPTCARTGSRAMSSSRSRSRRSARRQATPAPTRWTPSPISPRTIRTTRSRVARAEPHPAACRARRSTGGLRPPRFGWPRYAERRLDQRHHRLPGPRLLRAGDRALDPGRPAHCAEISATARAAKSIGPLKIKISGCINACGHHHVGHIGILGLERAGEETYQITLGGSGDEKAAIGQIVGPGLQFGERRRGGRDDRRDLHGPQARR